MDLRLYSKHSKEGNTITGLDQEPKTTTNQSFERVSTYGKGIKQETISSAYDPTRIYSYNDLKDCNLSMSKHFCRFSTGQVWM